MGAASTLAFIMVGRAAEGAEVRRRIATLQSAMTVGQIIGPLFGAIAAARLGIRARRAGRHDPAGLRGAGSLGGAAAAAKEQAGFRGPTAAPRGPRPSPCRPRRLDPGVLLHLDPAHVCPGWRRCGAHPRGGGGADLRLGRPRALGALAVPRLASCSPERKLIVTLLIASSVLRRRAGGRGLGVVLRRAALRPGAVDRARSSPWSSRASSSTRAVGDRVINAARIGPASSARCSRPPCSRGRRRRRLRPAGRDRPGLRPVRPGARGRSAGVSGGPLDIGSTSRVTRGGVPPSACAESRTRPVRESSRSRRRKSTSGRSLTPAAPASRARTNGTQARPIAASRT